uniref:Uncharacterized protein n=1 Tax=Panagrolaimus davidi TaxID=227884 RepID=A0A914PMJ2_9BILA
MSLSATIILQGARVRDLVKFSAENYALGITYMFQLKWKSLDINGIPKVTTLLPSSLVTHGEMYYMFINTRDDLELESNPSQMVL